MQFLLIWLATAVGLFVISRLGLGIEVRDTGTVVVAALVVGLFNAVLRPVAQILAFPLTVLTLGLFALVVNALLFWLAARLVDGFTLRNGFWSALVGSILVSLINGVILGILR